MNPNILSIILVVCIAILEETFPKDVNLADAEKHLVQRVEPEVPSIAKLLTGDCKVKLRIAISTSGFVSAAEILKGNPMLNGSAVEAVKKWKYEPFLENGSPTEVNADVEIAFPCGMSEEESAVRKKYYPVEDECRKLANSRNYTDGEKKCKEAVTISNELPNDAVLERSSVRSLLGHCIMYQGRIEESIPIYEEALALNRGYLKSNDADLATSYANLGRAYALIGELAIAEDLFAKSIFTFEAAILNIPELKENYATRLRARLIEYATIKELRGQKEEAAKLRKKAAELQ